MAETVSKRTLPQHSITARGGGEYNWIDYAKGIGIVLVVYGHSIRGLVSANIINDPIFKLIDSIIYTFHMPLFFFLSGLLFFKSILSRDIKLVAIKKIDKLIYVYLVWSFIQTIIEIFFSNLTNGNASLSELYSIVYYPRAQFWFLYALVLIVLFFYIWVKIFSTRFVFFAFVFSVAGYFFNSYFLSGFYFWMFFNHLVYFSMGGVVLYFYNRIDFDRCFFDIKSNAMISIFSFILVHFLFHGFYGMMYTDRGLMSLFVAMVSIYFIVSISVFLSKYSSKYLWFFPVLGVSSLYIYLMHIILVSGIRIFLQKIGVDNSLVHVVLGCFFGVVLPVYLAKYMKSTIFYDFLFGSAIGFCKNLTKRVGA